MVKLLETHRLKYKDEYLPYAKYFKGLLSLPESLHGQSDHKYAWQLAQRA